jgi:hypothetical protein
MHRVGVSGHRGLEEPTVSLVEHRVRSLLAPMAGQLVGVSALADGADQIFARVVLEMGGALEVIVPAEEYRAGLPAAAHAEYDRLLAAARTVTALPYQESSSESHMAAARRMLDGVDRLVAVWDGQPARGFGGTADVVREAEERGIPVDVVWPAGARRD